MPSLKRQPYTFLSLSSLFSLVLLSLYLARDGPASKTNSKRNGFSQLNARQSIASTAADNSSATVPPFGFAQTAANGDDPYTCGPNRPCSNGACCGPSGNCGYAPAYCGDGCLSNCDAKAECGQYAKNPGQTCPLNVCCSEHGFCGFTEEYCKPGCQSNCVLKPKPPGGSSKNASMDRVIGYYETWSYRSKCNQKSPSDLPLNELTHLNYAFAFIDPDSYELTTMDDKTTEDLWQMTVDTKRYNPNLEVYVAVGGWTFSDNDTETQPLLGEISRTAANRKKFADGVVKFLNKYGFDGLDIDWEYPGAPDRGGNEEDVPNFVLLMKVLRAAFDASHRPLGLTFTIPSSYWYLRWFDLQGLLKYADWTNLMSYDLHGTWDRNNPIGAIAQAHTNLTEIKQATELLWRAGVRPEQVVLGYGFYGRSFELKNKECSKPGCPFKGGASPGPCSDTSGILMYYEIQAILKQLSDLKPVFDKKAAVKYVVFDDDQWVSYDDEDTFKLKQAWANEVGFGGSMIWAVDTDDDKFSAMSGLIGYQVSHVDTDEGTGGGGGAGIALKMTDGNVGRSLRGENGQECAVLRDYECKNTDDLRCLSGETLVGWDRDGCDEDEGKPICCPTDTAPKKCVWRGSGNDGGIWGDCNGQCHAGEAKVSDSKWGGGFEKDRESDPYVCARGKKVFCCEAGDWKTVVDDCYWTPCFGGGDCKSGFKELATRKGNCPWSQENKYCCPKDTALHDCNWRGSAPECVDANCKMTEDGKELAEVQVDSHAGGGSWNLCSWDREKALCCQVSKALPPPLYCDTTSCDLDPLVCDQDGKDNWGNPLKKKRDAAVSVAQDNYDLDGLTLEDRDLFLLEKRGGSRDFTWKTTFGLFITQYSLAYPTPAGYMRRLRQGLQGLLARGWGSRSRSCNDPVVNAEDIEPDDAPPDDAQVEHTIPAVTIARFAAVANHGRQWAPRPAGRRERDRNGNWVERGQITPEGPETNTPAIRSREFWQNVWNNAEGMPPNLPRVTPTSPELRQPVDRLYEAIGSNTNARHFTLLQRNINAMKGRIEIYNSPMARTRLMQHVRDALDPNESEPTISINIMSFMAPLRETRGVFEYLRAEDVVTRLDATAALIYSQLQLMELHIPDAEGLSAHWNEFYPHYFSQVSEFARTWATDMIDSIREQYEADDRAYDRENVLKQLKEIEDDIPNWKYAFED